MNTVDRVDQFQRRHRILGYPLAVIYKYFDDAGGYLAALLTYYAFLSLFPVLLLLATVLSLVLRNNPDLQARILDSAISQIPVIGNQLQDPKSLSGGPVGVVIGASVAIYGALGVGNALQHAMNVIWSVRRNERPNPILSRVRSLLLIVTAGLAAVATTALSIFNAAISDWGAWTRVLILLVTIALNTGIVYLCFRIGISRAQRRHQFPGALLAAIGWHFLQLYGLTYVARVINRASAINSVFAFILGLLAFIYLTAVLVVICAEINVVSAQRLWPRALLTPFTDSVHLTEADRRVYDSQAKSMASKGFERVRVEFGPSPKPPLPTREGSGSAEGDDG